MGVTVVEKVSTPIPDALMKDLKNHYPPVNDLIVPLAAEAITRGWNDDYDTLLDLHKITGLGGWLRQKLTVRETITALYLWDFIDEEADEDCQETDPRDPIPNEW